MSTTFEATLLHCTAQSPDRQFKAGFPELRGGRVVQVNRNTWLDRDVNDVRGYAAPLVT